MASSGNFCTWNATHYQGGSGSTTTFSEGNCRVGTTSGGYPRQISNFAFPSSGKWYIELNNIVNNGYHVFGVIRQENMAYGDGLFNNTGQYHYQAWNGQKRGNNGSAQSYGSSWGSAGIIIGLAFDADNGKIWWAKDNTWQASGDPAGNSNEAFSGLDAKDNYYFGWSDYYTAKAGTVHINCGQDSSFAGSKTSGSANATDDNGFGDFYYAPPSGFLALCSANLPTSSDIDPAETSSDYPGKQCGVVTYTGTGSSTTISGLDFQPDFIWAKTRSTSSRHYLVDSSRGFTKYLHSEHTYSEGTSSDGVTSANSDGFVIGGGLDYVNYSGRTFVAWCWRANGGITASNSDGAISSTVQANQAAGFSIVQWTANATSSVATTVGHGLSKAPEFVITKSRESSTNWCVTHIGLSSTSHMLFLNTNATETDKSGNGNMSANTSTVFSVNATDGSNAPNGDNMIAYCWHSVEGYSKFGKYEGNANANGAFIYTGFRPRILIIRVLNVASDGWLIYDTERETFNPLDTVLKPHDEAADYSNAAFTLDILSNGFKLRSSDNAVNGTSYDPYIYMAWADVPFKYNNTF